MDPDENEVFTFRKKSGASNLLVKSTNGLVTSDVDVDIDPKDTKSFSIFMEVSDSAGHVAVTEVNVTLQDYNDNIPAFKAVRRIVLESCFVSVSMATHFVFYDRDSYASFHLIWNYNVLIKKKTLVSFDVI